MIYFTFTVPRLHRTRLARHYSAQWWGCVSQDAKCQSVNIYKATDTLSESHSINPVQQPLKLCCKTSPKTQKMA